MLASVISLLLLILLMQVYLSLKKVYLLHQAIQTLQENGRFASFFVKSQIEQAGDARCESRYHPILQQDFIRGFTKTNAPADFNRASLTDNDIVVTRQCIDLNSAVQFSQVSFYVAKTNRNNAQGEKVTALYEKAKSLDSGDHITMEIIPDVARMQVLYGVANSKGDITHYLPAANLSATDWQQVKAIEINFLLQSSENVLTQPQAYQFQQHTFLPKDRRLYRQWNTYIMLKEKA